jgi:sterol 14-demethylase
MFAGHETTAGQAAWTIILLLQNPDYLRLVQQEIQQVAPYGVHIDPRRMTQLDHISWAVREVERMRPSVDMLMRTVEQDVEVGDYVIPQGWLAQVAQDVAHNLPALFDDPESFDPLRYAPGRAEDKQDRFALIGFGGGTHKCTGMNFANMEMTVITALLFRQFDLELVTRHPQVQRGLGASRPDRTVVRYRRKPASEMLAQAALQQAEAGEAPLAAAFSRN